MDKKTLKELTKKISGRKFDEKKFNESIKVIREPEVEPEVEKSEESEGAELERVNSNGFSQQSQEIYNDIDNKLYLSSKNKGIYPSVR